MIGTKKYACNFVVSFKEYWLKIQICGTTFWWLMSDFVICMAQILRRTNDTGQLQILTNFTNTPLWHKSYHLLCCLARGVTGPNFFEDEGKQAITATSVLHRDDHLTSIAPKLPPNHNLWFKQDGATAHITVINMAALHHLFPRRVISHFSDVTWSPCLPDQTAPEFFL
jgi:hypothetical protein